MVLGVEGYGVLNGIDDFVGEIVIFGIVCDSFFVEFYYGLVVFFYDK